MTHFFSFYLKILIFTYFIIFFNQYTFIWFCNHIYEKAFLFLIFNLVWPISFYISVTMNDKFLSLLLLIYFDYCLDDDSYSEHFDYCTFWPFSGICHIWQVSKNFEPSPLFNPWEEVVPILLFMQWDISIYLSSWYHLCLSLNQSTWHFSLPDHNDYFTNA